MEDSADLKKSRMLLCISVKVSTCNGGRWPARPMGWRESPSGGEQRLVCGDFFHTEEGTVQPDLQPNGEKTWRTLGHSTDDLLDSRIQRSTLGGSGARWDKAWTVFKTVARAASWAREHMVLVSSDVRSRIDKAGRMVIPKALRDQLGLRPGEVELTADGSALRIVPIHDDALVEADGRLLIPESGIRIDDELVQVLRGTGRCSCGEPEGDAPIGKASRFTWS